MKEFKEMGLLSVEAQSRGQGSVVGHNCSRPYIPAGMKRISKYSQAITESVINKLLVYIHVHTPVVRHCSI